MFKFLKRKKEIRTVNPDPSWQALENFTGIGTLPSFAGRNAMAITAVNSAVTIISNLIAGLEPAIYRRTDKGKVRLGNHPLMATLRNPTGDGRVSWFNLVALMTTDYLLHGNAICVHDFTDGREILTPIPYNYVSQQATDNRIYYDITPPYFAGNTSEGTKRYETDRVMHWLDCVGSQDGGYTGRSAISRCAQAVDLTAQLDSNVGTYFKRAITASGVFSFKGELEDDTRKQFREEVKQAFTGSSNSGNFFVLDNETSFSPVGATNEQAQVAELRRQQTNECSRIFSIPVFFLNSDSPGTTFASSLEARTALATQVIIPMTRSFAEAFSLKFLGDDELLMLDSSVLTKETNSKDRATGLKTLIDSGVITPADARRMLGIESELDRGDADATG